MECGMEDHQLVDHVNVQHWNSLPMEKLRIGLLPGPVPTSKALLPIIYVIMGTTLKVQRKGPALVEECGVINHQLVYLSSAQCYHLFPMDTLNMALTVLLNSI
jgi:hypothetical protein